MLFGSEEDGYVMSRGIPTVPNSAALILFVNSMTEDVVGPRDT